MQSFVFLTLFVVGCAYGSPMANQYFDTLLNVVLPNEIQQLGLDPAYVPNFTFEFEDKVKILGKFKGKAEFFNGNLTGLSKAMRYSECQGPYYNFGSKNYNCTIGFNQLSINYNGKLKYGNLPKKDIKGKSNATLTLLFVEISQTPPMQATLRNFLFQQIGQLQVKFTGLSAISSLKFLEDGYKAHVQAEVFNSVSQRYQYALGSAVGKVPLPL